MKLSTRARYGTRAMIELARHWGNGPVKRRDIARNQDISPHYLENILITLKSAGLIKTIRGAEGGFVLAKPPSKTSMFEIVSALEGSIAPVECVEEPDKCKRSPDCPARLLWGRMHEVQKEVLLQSTLESIAETGKCQREGDYAI